MIKLDTAEAWRVVPSAPKYSVSSLGNVTGRYGKPMVQNVNENGYCRVTVWRGGKGKTTTVHSLVLEAFVGPRPKGQLIRHLNGDKRDNRLVNLAYGTYGENSDDAQKHGQTGRGARKLSVIQEQWILELRSKGFELKPLAEFFGVSVHTMTPWTT